jgi:uncharacterized membrane protein
MARPDDLRRARIGGVVLGIRMGGFLDGILLHQILQWHNMLSTVLPPSTLEAMHTNILLTRSESRRASVEEAK